jgi:hypothetical protein
VKANFGYHPRTALIRDDAGNLFGTTDTLTGQGGGVVFQLRPPYGTKTTWTLYSRAQLPHYGNAFAAVPAIGDLALDANGVLYGTTPTGGTLSACGGLGCGTAFRLVPPAKGASSLAPWALTTLYDFAGPTADGAAPHWGVALAPSGAVFGVTQNGGNGSCTAGCGTVFSLTPPASGATGWSETVPYAFKGASDGYSP